MPFGLTNRIDDDSDSKPVDFDHWFWWDTKSNNKLRIWSNLDHFLSEFDLFQLKDQYRDQKSELINQKSWLKDQKSQFLSKTTTKSVRFRPFSIKFDQFLI